MEIGKEERVREVSPKQIPYEGEEIHEPTPIPDETEPDGEPVRVPTKETPEKETADV